jgi:hypothetical protein
MANIKSKLLRAGAELSIPEKQRKLAHTIPEAVRASGISRTALYLAIGRGALHARKCGARTLILDSDLRRFLRNLPFFATGRHARAKQNQEASA